MIYQHSKEMGEISGFGGGYEALCQDMLEAGVNWLMNNPTVVMEGHSFRGVYGILIADSDDAKEMENAILAADKDKDATGAIHQAVMSRLFWIAKNGWDAYCAELIKSEAAE